MDEAYRRQGIATRLMSELEELARSRGITEGFVLTEPDNGAAEHALRSRSAANASEVVMWDYRYTDG